MSGRGALPARPPAASAAQMNAEDAQTLPRAAPTPCATCPQEIVRIGIFFDGTGNNKEKDVATASATNVAKLWNVYRHDESKLARAYYHGVGSSGGTLDTIFGGAFGAGGKSRIERHLQICSEFFTRGTNGEAVEKRIDLYGFSRGAALARDFANEVKNRGIEDRTRPPERYETIYAGEGPPVQIPVYPRVRGVKVCFVGVFDTVSSFGMPGNNTDIGYNFTVDDSYIGKTVHLISEDELRGNFSLQSIRGKDAQGPEPLPANCLEEAFPGVHSDVGGGYAPDEQGRQPELAHIPLKRMHEESVAFEVPMDPLNDGVGPHEIPGPLQALYEQYRSESAPLLQGRYLQSLEPAEYTPVAAQRQQLPAWIELRAKYIHRQEFAWTSPSAWGNSNREQRKVFYNPARGLRGGQ